MSDTCGGHARRRLSSISAAPQLRTGGEPRRIFSPPLSTDVCLPMFAEATNAARAARTIEVVFGRNPTA